MLSILGYASGIAANDTGCADGPLALQQANLISQLKQQGFSSRWLDTLYPNLEKPILSAVADICGRLACYTHNLYNEKKTFAVLGGDHSSAIGTWSGVFAAMQKQGSLGLIWIDAHMDSHTFETTPSGNIHGMPLACLLGYGAPELINIETPTSKILPQHLSLIGIRSYEEGEAALLKRLGVRIYPMTEVNQRGLETVLLEAVARASLNTAGYGISIDLDALDPEEAPGVSIPESNGLNAIELCRVFKKIKNDPKRVGAEIVEFNPHADQEHRTEKLIFNLLLSLFRT